MINELTRKNAHTELDHIFKTILPRARYDGEGGADPPQSHHAGRHV